MNIDKIILTGLHKSGKSTFISKLIKNHDLAYSRLNMNKTLYNLDKFDLFTYINFFDIFDRSIFIEPFVYWDDVELFKYFIYGIKDYLKNTLICINLFCFEESIGNTERVKLAYEEIAKVLSKNNLKVITFRTKEDWIDFSENFSEKYTFNQNKNFIEINNPKYEMSIDYFIKFYHKILKIGKTDKLVSYLKSTEEFKKFIGIYEDKKITF